MAGHLDERCFPLSQGLAEVAAKDRESRPAPPVIGVESGGADARDSAFDDAVTRLTKLCSLLANDSEQVQELVLRDISQVLQDNEMLIHSRFVSAGGNDAASNVVMLLLTKLLDVCRRTSSASVRQRCALCLGQVGAVDPSRVNLAAPHEQVCRFNACLLLL